LTSTIANKYQFRLPYAGGGGGGGNGRRRGKTGKSGNTSIMRRHSFLEGARSALPEVGERTIYVTDEGLIVSAN